MRLPLLGRRGLSLRQRAQFGGRVEEGAPWVEAIARERDVGGNALATSAGERLLEQDDDTVRSALFAALAASEVEQTVVVLGGDDWLAQSAASELASGLARRKLSYTAEDVRLLLSRMRTVLLSRGRGSTAFASPWPQPRASRATTTSR